MASGEPDVAFIVHQHGRKAETTLHPREQELESKVLVVSRAAVPIPIAPRVGGVLTAVTDGTSGRTLTQVEIDVLTEVASLIGVAINERDIPSDLSVASWPGGTEANHG